MAKNKAFKPQMHQEAGKRPVLQTEFPVDEVFLAKRKVSREGFAWCLYLLGSNLFRLIWLNLLLALCCVTVIFAPAAITGACRGILILLRGRGGLFWADFREDFLDRFWKKLGMWLLMILLPVALGLWMYILGLGAEAVHWVVFMGLLISMVVQTYFFTMLAAMKLSLEDCLKNALLLTILEWKTTFVFLLLYGVVMIATYLLFPYSIPVLCFVLISCMMLVVCQQVRRIIIRRGLYLPEEKTEETFDSAVEGE